MLRCWKRTCFDFISIGHQRDLPHCVQIWRRVSLHSKRCKIFVGDKRAVKVNNVGKFQVQFAGRGHWCPFRLCEVYPSLENIISSLSVAMKKEEKKWSEGNNLVVWKVYKDVWKWKPIFAHATELRPDYALVLSERKQVEIENFHENAN
jgi:hypothetical protein